MAFKDEAKKYVDKGVTGAKVAFSKAGEAIQNFGDKSVLRIEIAQANSKLRQKNTELGKAVFATFEQGAQSISATDEKIASLITEMKTLKEEIAHKKDLLKG